MAAGLIVRVFGFVYRIYLSNLIGAEGMGLFQLISPVYSLIILTLTSGVSIAVSRMVAEETARGHFANTRRITFCALVLVSVSGAAISALMYMNMDFVTGVLLKDSRTYSSMVLLMPCIPVIAAASALKGYFYGIQNVTPTALSQIAEQIVRIGLVMLMARHFVGLGLEYACALATVGMAAGEIANLGVLVVIYKLGQRKDPYNEPGRNLMRKRRIIREISAISIPVSANRFITSIMSAIEVILIPRRLVAGGMEYQSSMEMYGRLEGMAMPLLFFPALVTSSIAITLVPAISEAMSLKNFRSVNNRISKAIRIAFILGFVFTALFFSYPDEIGSLLYKRENIGDILRSFSFICVFIYLQQVLLGILNGLGKQSISLRNSVIGYAMRIGFVYFLLPVYGIKSYVWGIIASYSCVCALNVYAVVKNTGLALDVRNWILKPGLISLGMVFASRYIYSFFTIFISQGALTTVFAVAANLAIALLLMAMAGVMGWDELLRLSGLKKRRKSENFYIRG